LKLKQNSLPRLRGMRFALVSLSQLAHGQNITPPSVPDLLINEGANHEPMSPYVLQTHRPDAVIPVAGIERGGAIVEASYDNER
jgi:hypothetical protein